MIQEKSKSTKSIWLGRIMRYGPLLLWFSLIFYASTDHLSNENTSKVVYPFIKWLFFSPSEATIEILHIIIRKIAHFTEYAVLAFFLARATTSSTKDWLNKNWFKWSISIIVLYALLDEYHQSFESTRMASIYDSLIDISGGLTVLCFFYWKIKQKALIKERLLQAN